MVRVFANVSGDLGSIPGRVIPMTLKMVLDTSLLTTQQYKVGIFWSKCIQLTLTFIYVDTAVWMHHLDAEKTAREKAGQQLHKNVASNIK